MRSVVVLHGGSQVDLAYPDPHSLDQLKLGSEDTTIYVSSSPAFVNELSPIGCNCAKWLQVSHCHMVHNRKTWSCITKRADIPRHLAHILPLIYQRIPWTTLVTWQQLEATLPQQKFRGRISEKILPILPSEQIIIYTSVGESPLWWWKRQGNPLLFSCPVTPLSVRV